MGLGTGVKCKYCGRQIYMDDPNSIECEEKETCYRCLAIKRIAEEERIRL